MTPTELMAQKMLNEAIAAYKARKRDEAMALEPLPENDEKRRALVTQFQVADDVGKTIALKR